MMLMGILSVADVILVRHYLRHYVMEGQEFEITGMGQFKDGTNTLFFPVYKLKGDN